MLASDEIGTAAPLWNRLLELRAGSATEISPQAIEDIVTTKSWIHTDTFVTEKMISLHEVSLTITAA